MSATTPCKGPGRDLVYLKWSTRNQIVQRSGQGYTSIVKTDECRNRASIPIASTTAVGSAFLSSSEYIIHSVCVYLTISALKQFLVSSNADSY